MICLSDWFSRAQVDIMRLYIILSAGLVGYLFRHALPVKIEDDNDVQGGL